jgi:hypothetical protein
MSDPSATSAIFLSYRRSDTGGYAGRLVEELEVRFGKGSVFQDVAAIAPGSDFAHAIETAITHCQVLIVLIGDTWLAERDAGGRLRLHDPNDFVRMEVAAALRAKRPVLPVLVEEGKMPAAGALPSDLEGLARLQALELSDTRWEYDVERLASAIRRLTGHVHGSKRRRMLALVGATTAALAVGTVLYLVRGRQPIDISGRWNLPSGSYWVVVQNGRQLNIEETHYDSKQVWKRGSGTVTGDRLEFSLDLVYESQRRLTGDLRVSADRNSLSGEVRDTRGSKALLVLTRAR